MLLSGDALSSVPLSSTAGSAAPGSSAVARAPIVTRIPQRSYGATLAFVTANLVATLYSGGAAEAMPVGEQVLPDPARRVTAQQPLAAGTLLPMYAGADVALPPGERTLTDVFTRRAAQQPDAARTLLPLYAVHERPLGASTQATQPRTAPRDGTWLQPLNLPLFASAGDALPPGAQLTNYVRRLAAPTPALLTPDRSRPAEVPVAEAPKGVQVWALPRVAAPFRDLTWLQPLNLPRTEAPAEEPPKGSRLAPDRLQRPLATPPDQFAPNLGMLFTELKPPLTVYGLQPIARSLRYLQVDAQRFLGLEPVAAGDPPVGRSTADPAPRRTGRAHLEPLHQRFLGFEPVVENAPPPHALLEVPGRPAPRNVGWVAATPTPLFESLKPPTTVYADVLARRAALQVGAAGSTLPVYAPPEPLPPGRAAFDLPAPRRWPPQAFVAGQFPGLNAQPDPLPPGRVELPTNPVLRQPTPWLYSWTSSRFPGYVPPPVVPGSSATRRWLWQMYSEEFDRLAKKREREAERLVPSALTSRIVPPKPQSPAVAPPAAPLYARYQGLAPQRASVYAPANISFASLQPTVWEILSAVDDFAPQVRALGARVAADLQRQEEERQREEEELLQVLKLLGDDL